MNSASSTEVAARPRASGGLHPWQFYLLLSLAAATVAVALTRHTGPAALILLSVTIIGAGAAASALYVALAGFFGFGGGFLARGPITGRRRDLLLREKALILRSIKELEFDRAMGKVSPADFADINRRLRARALALMEDLDHVAERGDASDVNDAAETPTDLAAGRACGSCGTRNDADARFCKQCGAKVDA